MYKNQGFIDNIIYFGYHDLNLCFYNEAFIVKIEWLGNSMMIDLFDKMKIPWRAIHDFIHRITRITTAILIMYHSYVWVNYKSSLTWIKAIWGWFPLFTMIPGFGRSEFVIIYPDMCIYVYIVKHIYIYKYVYYWSCISSLYPHIVVVGGISTPLKNMS